MALNSEQRKFLNNVFSRSARYSGKQLFAALAAGGVPIKETDLGQEIDLGTSVLILPNQGSTSWSPNWASSDLKGLVKRVLDAPENLPG